MELYHYGVKGMKWHEHRMAREDETKGRRTGLTDRLAEEAARLQAIAEEAQSVQAPAEAFLSNPSKENLQKAWDTYNHISPEARDAINAFVATQIKAFGSDMKKNWYKYAAQGLAKAGQFAADEVEKAVTTRKTRTLSTTGTYDRNKYGAKSSSRR